jgi:sulfate adenylyltransferase large subunit
MTPFGENEDGGLLRFTTAGSVDDGKSSLIGRLLYDANAVPLDRLAALERIAERNGDRDVDLSLLMDGLVAEREQGITIDVAYSYFTTPRRKFIIADTPGHEQYTRNMVTGASTAGAAVILVDARRGITVQTRRHLYLSHLLGVPHLVVAVNKMDLVGFDADVFTTISKEIFAFAAAIGAVEPLLVPISAKFGDNVVHRSPAMGWYDGKTLLALLETLPETLASRHLPFRFAVQLVRRVASPGDGRKTRQYLGRIDSGRLRQGDEVVVMPSGMTSRVRAISTFDGPLESAHAPQSIVIEVEDELDIARGDVLAAPLAPPRTATSLEAMICWFSDQAFSGAGQYLVKSGTRTVAGRIAELVERVDVATLQREPAPATLKRNDIARIRLVLASPLAVDAYEDNRATGAFILIDPNSNETVAAGMIARAPGDRAAPGIAGFDPGL